jgi:hypothetical protein
MPYTIKQGATNVHQAECGAGRLPLLPKRRVNNGISGISRRTDALLDVVVPRAVVF